MPIFCTPWHQCASILNPILVRNLTLSSDDCCLERVYSSRCFIIMIITVWYINSSYSLSSYLESMSENKLVSQYETQVKGSDVKTTNVTGIFFLRDTSRPRTCTSYVWKNVKYRYNLIFLWTIQQRIYTVDVLSIQGGWASVDYAAHVVWQPTGVWL